LLLSAIPARAADTPDPDTALLGLYKSGGLFDRKQYRPLRAALAEAFARKHADTIREAFGENHDSLSAWLGRHPDIREELFVALDEQHDDLKAALALFAQLWKEFPGRVESHAPLAIATAVVWDRPTPRQGKPGGLYDYRSHQLRTKSNLPDGMVDARGNFEYLSGKDAILADTIKVLPWEFLVFVVDHTTPLKERKWAQQYVLTRRGRVSSWHQDIAYDHGMLQTERTGKGPGPKLAGHDYTLENIKRYGGVCAQQADFVARVGKSLGQPSMYVHGKSSYRGWHAWVMWVSVGKPGKAGKDRVRFDLVSDGRTRGFEKDAFYVGHLTDPQTGRTITDRDLWRRLSVIGADPLAARQARLVMRAYPTVCKGLGVKERLAYLDRTLQLVPQSEEAWLEVARLTREGELKGAWRGAAANKLAVLTKTFSRHPDFIARLSDDLLAPETSRAPKVRHYAHVASLFEKASRPDLCCDVRLKLAKLHAEQKRYKDATQVLTLGVRKFPTEGRYIPRLLAAYEEVCENYKQGVTALANLYVDLAPALARHYKGENNPFLNQVVKQALAFFESKGLARHEKTFKSPSDTLRAGDFQTFLAYTLLYRAQNQPLLASGKLHLLVLAPRLTRPYREELRVLGVAPQQQEKGIWRLHGGMVLHPTWVLETEELAGLDHPLLTLFSPTFLANRVSTYEMLRKAGHTELVVYLAQQIHQFRLLGREFAMQHLGADTELVEVLRDILATLPPEERLRTLTVEDLRKLPPQELERLLRLLGKELATQHPGADTELVQAMRDLLVTLPPEERLRGLPPEERLRGLTVDDLRKLPPEERERLRRLLQQLPPEEGATGSS
jgi:hypothetical protein